MAIKVNKVYKANIRKVKLVLKSRLMKFKLSEEKRLMVLLNRKEVKKSKCLLNLPFKRKFAV
jgi:hypothetical protein